MTSRSGWAGRVELHAAGTRRVSCSREMPSFEAEAEEEGLLEGSSLLT